VDLKVIQVLLETLELVDLKGILVLRVILVSLEILELVDLEVTLV